MGKVELEKWRAHFMSKLRGESVIFVVVALNECSGQTSKNALARRFCHCLAMWLQGLGSGEQHDLIWRDMQTKKSLIKSTINSYFRTEFEGK